jgi:hypothetical protein
MLTTEQLRARAKFWREKAVEAKWESVSIAQDMLQNADAFDELATYREAQPVGYAENGKGFIYPPERRDRIKNPVAVYTAPPAPAVPEGWKMVPVEPTEEMLRAAFREASVYSPTAYRAMLAAAPEGGN